MHFVDHREPFELIRSKQISKQKDHFRYIPKAWGNKTKRSVLSIAEPQDDFFCFISLSHGVKFEFWYIKTDLLKYVFKQITFCFPLGTDSHHCLFFPGTCSAGHLLGCQGVYVVVQFYLQFNFYFLVFQNHYHRGLKKVPSHCLFVQDK